MSNIPPRGWLRWGYVEPGMNRCKLSCWDVRGWTPDCTCESEGESWVGLSRAFKFKFKLPGRGVP
eukprot:1583705-Rhodomonas_salina.1